jgi:outer membrane protein assembly factor BamB
MIRAGIFCLFFLLLLNPTPGFSNSLIDEADAQTHGLSRPWVSQVQLDRSRDKVESVTLGNGIVLVQTQLGTLQAFDAETGKSLWVNHVGSPRHPTTPIGVGPGHVAVINGSQLHVFDRLTGKFIWKRKVGGSVGAAPEVNKEHVFVPKVNGILEAYELKGAVHPVWKHKAHGRSMVQPVVSGTTVGWPSDRGAFYVAATKPPEILFRTEIYDGIDFRPTFLHSHYYIASNNGYLYKVHEKTGDIKWRFSTGESIANRPIVTDGRVYITTEQGGLYCISSTLGVRKEPRAAAKTNVRNSDNNQQIWQNKDVVRLLAVTPDRIFGMDKLDNIHILSADTGRSLGRLQTEGISLPVVNHISDRIYLVTDTGLVQCLRDTRLSKPHYHSPQNNIGANNKQPGTDGESVEGSANLSEEGTENRNSGENASEEKSENPFDS